jgi:uncharacterized protein YegP (UPF0339 family)
MRNCFVILFLFALLVVLPADDLIGSGKISGKVIQSDTTIPVIGAIVEIYKNDTTKSSVVTDASGSYNFTLDAGNYDIFVSSTGYIGKFSANVEIISGKSKLLDFQLTSAPKGLVGYWNFDENSDSIAFDYSGHKNKGTIVGAEPVDGRNKTGLKFYGPATYVHVPNSKSINISGHVTFEAWAYFEGETPGDGDNGNQIILSKFSDPGVAQYAVTRFQQRISYSHKLTMSLSIGGWKDHMTDSAIHDGKWYHIAASYDNKTVKIYINGQLVKSIPASGSVRSGNGDFYIGLNPVTGIGKPEAFNGIIDEVRIYNRALTLAEIRTDMGKYEEPKSVMPDTVPEKGLNVAVNDFEGKNVSAVDAGVVADFIRTELVKREIFNVLERSNMETILGEQKFQISGCTTEDCAIKMGKLLNVHKIIIGKLTLFQGIYHILVNIVDVETAKIDFSDKVTYQDPADIDSTICEIVNRIESRYKK